ncbi:MAG: glutaminyl-tRNA synthase (glutamine-hydrolyzing) subunit B [Candidatus Altiarchaeales archaeon A3]|nr:MAG: glutaminyl-tRNA synthase (glutamine-hydrolyzing) subunit B [Candidatus Altiarchaeales archaeon A3]
MNRTLQSQENETCEKADNIKIGLEIHIPIKTKQKLFCDCKTNYHEISEPNVNVCPVCTGMPGIKPYPINSEGLSSAIMLAKLLNCKLNEKIFVKRKHYNYPDLPSGYQRTSEPIGVDGNLNNIGIWEVHIEEDPGKYDLNYKRVDYNRSGTVLAEIVTAPDMHSPEEARNFFKDLVNLAKYTNKIVETGGVMRADVNVSIEGGARVEIKNVNSIKGMVKALKYEILRQKNLKSVGGEAKMETRGYDENQMITVPLRTKETAADYRYIPDPDIPPVYLKEISETITLPETPRSRKERLISRYCIKDDYADILVRNKELADIFEEISSDKDKTTAEISSSWICREVLRQLNYRDIEWTDEKNKLNGKILSDLFVLLANNSITENTGKKILERVIDSGDLPGDIVEKENLMAESNDDVLKNIINDVLAKNQKAVDDYKAGNKSSVNFLVGQIMRSTRGKADNKKVMEILDGKLGN